MNNQALPALVLAFLVISLRLSAGPLDRWHWRQPLPQGNDVYGMTFGEGRFVAVGDRTTLDSPDGFAWNVHGIDQDAFLTRVAYGNGRFVAVGKTYDGTTNLAMTSDYGAAWTTHYLPGSGFRLEGLTFGNGTFVAVGPISAHPGSVILTSPDGVTWMDRSLDSRSDLHAITHGNGLFLAVGNDPAGPVILTSPDGATWTPRDTGLTGYSLTGIAYGNGQFVAFAQGFVNSLADDGTLTSIDGTTWTPASFRSLPFFYFADVAFGNGSFVALGQDLTSGTKSVMWISSDGVGWSRVNLGTMGNASLRAVTFGNGRFATSGDYGNLASSADGTHWTPVSSATQNNLRGVTYANQTFVAVGNNGTNLTSPDGLTWTGHASGTTVNLHDLTWANDTFVSVGNGGAILTSSNGTQWTPRGSGTTLPLMGITHADAGFVAVGGDVAQVVGFGVKNMMILTSGNGIAWVDHSFQDADSSLHGVTAGNGLLVAVGRVSRLFTSPDGSSWSRMNVPGGSAYLKGIAFGNGTYVAVGAAEPPVYNTGIIVTSKDGVVWTNLATSTPSLSTELDEITYANGLFVAVGTDGACLSSRDGSAWIRHPLPSSSRIRGVGYGQGTFLLVLNNDTILQSDSFIPGELSIRKAVSGSLDLMVTGQIGRGYRLQRATEACAPDWADLSAFTLDDTTRTLPENPVDRGPRQVYRLVSP